MSFPNDPAICLKVFQQPTGEDLLSLSKQNDLTNV